VKYWEIIADNLSKAGWGWGCVSAIDFNGGTIWIADAHRERGHTHLRGGGNGSRRGVRRFSHGWRERTRYRSVGRCARRRGRDVGFDYAGLHLAVAGPHVCLVLSLLHAVGHPFCVRRLGWQSHRQHGRLRAGSDDRARRRVRQPDRGSASEIRSTPRLSLRGRTS
jgi:hypothetical protein